MGKKCISCGKVDVSEKKTYCFFCDPNISDERKLEVRRKGGFNSKKKSLPGWFDINDYLPLSPANIKRYFGDLMRVAYELHKDDAAKFFSAQKAIVPKAQEYAYLEALLELQSRTDQLEQGNGKLLEGSTEDGIIDIEATNAED